MCHSSPVVSEYDVRSIAEQHLGRGVRTIHEVPGGFGHSTFIVEGRRVFLFARTAEAAERDRVEYQVLPLIEMSVSFAVPSIEFDGTLRGLPYIGYRMLPGRALRASDVPSLVTASDLANLVFELHSVPVDDVAGVLGESREPSQWKARYRRVEDGAKSRLSAVLPSHLQSGVAEGFERFFSAGFAFDPVLVHGDLGASHILVEESGGLIGILDFEAVAIGDPAVDFVGFQITLGRDTCMQVVEAYRGPVDEGFGERVLGYWWIGSLQAILCGLDEGDPAIVESGIAGLHERLARLFDR